MEVLHWGEGSLHESGVTNPAHRAKISSSLVKMREKQKRASLGHRSSGLQTLTNRPISPLIMDDKLTIEKLKRDLDAELRLDDSDVRSHGWYHGPIPRAHAQKLLQQEGQFLVRDSISDPGGFVLSVCFKSQCLNFKVNRVVQNFPGSSYTKTEYHFEGQLHPTVPALVMSHVGLSPPKPITDKSQAVISIPVNRTMPITYYAEKYGLMSPKNGTNSWVYSPGGSSASTCSRTSSSPMSSPRLTPVNSPTQQRKTLVRRGSDSTATSTRRGSDSTSSLGQSSPAYNVSKLMSHHLSTQDLMTSTTPRHKQMHKPSASDSGIFIENIAPPTDVDKKDNQSSLPLPDFHNNENGNNGNDVTVASPTHPPAKGPKLQRSFHASHTTCHPVSSCVQESSPETESPEPPPKPSRVPTFKKATRPVINIRDPQKYSETDIYSDYSIYSHVQRSPLSPPSSGHQTKNRESGSSDEGIGISPSPPDPQSPTSLSPEGQDGHQIIEHMQHLRLKEPTSPTGLVTSSSSLGGHPLPGGHPLTGARPKSQSKSGPPACPTPPPPLFPRTVTPPGMPKYTGVRKPSKTSAPPANGTRSVAFMRQRKASQGHLYVSLEGDDIGEDYAKPDYESDALCPDDRVLTNPPDVETHLKPLHFATPKMPADIKLLDEDIIKHVKSVLLGPDLGPAALARHLTKVDMDMLKLTRGHDLGMGVSSGLEVITLPQGKAMRTDLLERYTCLQFLVAIMLLKGCVSHEERAKMLNVWIEVARELRENIGNLNSYAAIIEALASHEIRQITEMWDLLRRHHTTSAFAFESRLLPHLKLINKRENNVGCEDTCIPYIIPLVTWLERDPTTPFVQEPWEETETDLGLEMLWTSLETSRLFMSDVSKFGSKAGAHNNSFMVVEEVLDVFRTEFQMKLLFGSKGCVSSMQEREKKFRQLIRIYSGRIALTAT